MSAYTAYGEPKVRSMAIRETPVYRVGQAADYCNNTELLASLVGGRYQIEIAERLLSHFGNVQRLANAPVDEIAGIYGIGKQTATRLKAAFALGRRALNPVSGQMFINSPSEAYEVLNPYLSNREQEYLYVVPLTIKNGVIDVIELYHGNLNSAIVRTSEVFRVAIPRNSMTIVIGHCHPSGDPTPSPDDIALTRNIKSAGKLLDIELVDHIIIANSRWVSLKEKGYM